MQLPQRLIIHFIPIDEGQLAEIEIEAKYKTEEGEIEELLRWALESYLEYR